MAAFSCIPQSAFLGFPPLVLLPALLSPVLQRVFSSFPKPSFRRQKVSGSEVEKAIGIFYTHLTPDLQKIRAAGKHLLALINDIRGSVEDQSREPVHRTGHYRAGGQP
jgi:hypothetical protein